MQAETKVASRVRFITLCNFLKRVKDARSGKDRKRILSEFISNWRDWHKEMHGQSETEDCMFDALRLLAPELDKTRAAYGMKEKSLAKLYAESLRISDESAEGRRLANFHLPSAWNAHAGDLAEVVFDVLQNRASAESSTYTVAMINDALDELANGDKQQVRTRMLALIHDLSAIEQKFLIRIILKDPGIGLSGKSVLAAYHSDAEQLFAVTQSLDRVARTLRDPHIRLREVAIALNVAFQPQLAENCPLRELVATRLRGAPFLIETKFDGERVQLHKDGANYRYFSRSGHDWTVTYGDSPSAAGSLTRFIHPQFAPHVQNCILDGEMMLFDSLSGRLVTKAQTDVDVKHANTAIDEPDDDNEAGQCVAASAGKQKQPPTQTCFVAFDIVYLNGRVLTSVPLHERKAELAKAVASLDGRLQVTSGQAGACRADCVAALNAAVAKGDEGVVLKRLDSVYECAARRAGWFKLKADYVDGLCDELDLLVLGVFFGMGTAGHYRTGSVSHFLMGLRDTAGADTTFTPLVKVSAGFSARQLRELSVSWGSKLHKFGPSEVPACFRLSDADSSRRLREMPDFWILPEDSCVVQVRAAEIMPSTVYPVGFTLRHARARALRRDRSWRDTMSCSEFEQLRIASHGKLVRKQLTEADLIAEELGEHAPGDDSSLLAKLDFGDDEDSGMSPRKRGRRGDDKSGGASNATGRGARGARKLQVAAACRGVDKRSVTRLGDIFQGLEFCVLLPTQKRANEASATKTEMETLILAHAGHVVQNASATSTDYVVAESACTVRVASAVQTGAYDIVKPAWLQRCVATQRFTQPNPTDFVHMRNETSSRFAKLFDRFGDSFTEPIQSVQQLSATLHSVPAQSLVPLNSDEIFELHSKEIGVLRCVAGLFRPLRFSVPSYWQHVAKCCAGQSEECATLELKKRIVVSKLRLLGGVLVDCEDALCSHTVIVQSASSAQLFADALQQLLTPLVSATDAAMNRRKIPRVVTARWVDDCVARGEILEERAYWPLQNLN